MNRRKLVAEMNHVCDCIETCEECPIGKMTVCTDGFFEDLGDDELLKTHNILCENWAKLNTTEANNPIK